MSFVWELSSIFSLSLFAVCDHQMRAERESWEKKQQEVGQLASELRNVRVTTFFIRTFLFCSEKKQNSLCFLLVKRERLSLKLKSKLLIATIKLSLEIKLTQKNSYLNQNIHCFSLPEEPLISSWLCNNRSWPGRMFVSNNFSMMICRGVFLKLETRNFEKCFVRRLEKY